MPPDPARVHVQEASGRLEPPDVVAARELIKRWKARHGHDSYVEPIEGGYKGYRGQCWDCNWEGPARLRDPLEEMGTKQSRRHKRAATQDAIDHQNETKPADWREGA